VSGAVGGSAGAADITGLLTVGEGESAFIDTVAFTGFIVLRVDMARYEKPGVVAVK
jgi:hypothetical protein